MCKQCKLLISVSYDRIQFILSLVVELFGIKGCLEDAELVMAWLRERPEVNDTAQLWLYAKRGEGKSVSDLVRSCLERLVAAFRMAFGWCFTRFSRLFMCFSCYSSWLVGVGGVLSAVLFLRLALRGFLRGYEYEPELSVTSRLRCVRNGRAQWIWITRDEDEGRKQVRHMMAIPIRYNDLSYT